MELRKSDHFLFTLLCIDLIFIFTSFFHYFSDLNLKNFLVDGEGSYAEKFQYLKFLGISAMSLILAIRKKSIGYIFFTTIPLYLFWDDARALHEQFGAKIAPMLSKDNYMNTLFINFRYQDIGEIIYMLTIAFIIFIIFLISFRKANKTEKYFLKKIIKFLFIYGFFAIFVDLIHQFSWGKINYFLSIIEDGGEMIPITIICGAFLKHIRERKNRPQLS